MKKVLLTFGLLLGFAAAGQSPLAMQEKSEKAREQKSLVARAKVWLPSDVASKDLFRGPQGDGFFEPGQTIECDYLDKKMSGLSPKFSCKLANGDELKVKYGGDNGEVYAEVIDRTRR